MRRRRSRAAVVGLVMLSFPVALSILVGIFLVTGLRDARTLRQDLSTAKSVPEETISAALGAVRSVASSEDDDDNAVPVVARGSGEGSDVGSGTREPGPVEVSDPGRPVGGAEAVGATGGATDADSASRASSATPVRVLGGRALFAAPVRGRTPSGSRFRGTLTILRFELLGGRLALVGTLDGVVLGPDGTVARRVRGLRVRLRVGAAAGD
nr:hypothetical protein [Actinomycetota bacterium]